MILLLIHVLKRKLGKFSWWTICDNSYDQSFNSSSLLSLSELMSLSPSESNSALLCLQCSLANMSSIFIARDSLAVLQICIGVVDTFLEQVLSHVLMVLMVLQACHNDARCIPDS